MGMAKCFTFPVIDIQSSVDNLVTKALVYDPDMEAGLQAL